MKSKQKEKKSYANCWLKLLFLGWLTSIPYHPTRAYCLYCKKDLHAHRLSLLKHMCTMKHQRSALAKQCNGNLKPNIQYIDTDQDKVFINVSVTICNNQLTDLEMFHFKVQKSISMLKEYNYRISFHLIIIQNINVNLKFKSNFS